MTKKVAWVVTTVFICAVWLANGLFCKILNLVPRHQHIVARILGDQYSASLTMTIGIAEVLMVIWIASRIKSRFCAVIQMVVVGTMNIIEFIVAPDLLLFGRMNILFAGLFVVLIYVNELVLSRQKQYLVTGD